jgi:hypothetical protein
MVTDSSRSKVIEERLTHVKMGGHRCCYPPKLTLANGAAVGK